jgi:hypothetical protein
MGCNCGKAKKEFKALINQQISTQPTQPTMTRDERIRRRSIRIEARAQRIADRNAAILASEAAKKNFGNKY